MKNEFWLSITDLSEHLKSDPKEILKELLQEGYDLPSKQYIQPSVVRKFLQRKGYKYAQKVISFQMLKGGVAKTTSALNFGLRAAMYGCQVLFIDLDQQANLTFALGADAEDKSVWVDVVEKKAEIEDIRISIQDGIDLIPSSLNNSVLDRVLLNGQRNWAQAVKAPLSKIKASYDLVIIDTAPNLSAINTAVSCASDLVILPINPDKFSLLGLKKHREDLQDLKNEFDLSFEEKILFTRYDGRESSSREILTFCIDQFAETLLKHYIRTSSDIKNSIGASKNIFSSKSNAKEDYDLLTRELLGMI